MWGRKARQAVEGAGSRSLWQQHRRVLVESYQRLWQTPLLSVMTVLVIAVAWVLPAQMTLLLQQGQAFMRNWNQQPQMTVYLKPDQTVAQAQTLHHWLIQQPYIVQVDVITPEEALAEFKKSSGFQLDDLAENPLPAVLRVAAAKDHGEALVPIKSQLIHRADIDEVQLDERWLQRLNALLNLGRSILLAVAISLAVTVLLVIVSVVRLMIEGRREEIQVTKLIGATNGFVRRPFLYTGFWYGVLGGLVALVIVWGVNIWLSPFWQRVLTLFDAHTEQVYPGIYFSVVLLAVSAVLGMIGAFFAVLRHLNEIEPQ